MASVLSRWEEAAGRGASIVSIAGLCRELIVRPVPVFEELMRESVDARRRVVRALLFVAVMGYLRLACEALTVAAAGRWSAAPEAARELAAAFFSSPGVLLRPVVAFLATLVCVGFGVKLVLGLEKPLLPAFLVVCYKSASEAFCLIPLVGGVLALVASIVLVIAGLRVGYRLNAARSFFAGLLLPFFTLLFGLVSVGPAANRAVLFLYPELQGQVMRMNDMTAYAYTTAIAKAAQEYEKTLGFAPSDLEAVKKFLPAAIADDLGEGDAAAGYRFGLRHLDDKHYRVEASPLQNRVTGRFAFSADETGHMTTTGAEGAPWAGQRPQKVLP